MTATELFEHLYPEEEKGVERMLSKKFIVAFAEAYAEKKVEEERDKIVDAILKQSKNIALLSVEVRKLREELNKNK